MSPFLKRLWVGMLTQDVDDAGTNSEIALAVSEEGADRLYYIFPGSTQSDQERGLANLYEVPDTVVTPAKISGTPLQTPHGLFLPVGCHIHIRGEDFGGRDAWRPEMFFVWGERLEDDAVLPISLSFKEDLAEKLHPSTPSEGWLSTDPSEGDPSVPLDNSINAPSAEAPFQRLLALIITSAEEDSGTNDTIRLDLDIGAPSPTVHSEITLGQPGTPQEDLETGEANLYEFAFLVDGDPVEFSYDMLNPTSLSLHTDGADKWQPSSFFLFGFVPRPEDTVSIPAIVVPLVYLPVWNLGPLSVDSNEGRRTIILPLAPPPPAFGSPIP